MSSFPPSCAAPAGPKRAPRPCLKRAIKARSSSPPSLPPPVQSPFYPCSQSASPAPSMTPHPHSHVHFPPSQSLSTTFPTHSKKTYDRRPLVVTPNICALPARGSPGRTYPLGAYMRRQSEMALGAHDEDSDMDINLDALLFSPAPPWVEASSSSPTPPASSQRGLPALVSDHGVSSSESEESDVLMSPPGHGRVPHFAYSGDTQMGERRLDFLPHPPSREQGRDRDRDRERENRRRRRRELEEERGRWKTGGPVSGNDEWSCLGGF